MCATLGNSLHSSIIDEKLRPSLVKENTLTNQIDSVDRSNDHTPKQVKICERPRGRSTRHGRHSHRRRNRLDFEDFDDVYASGHLQHGDRPLSLPSLHRITSDSQELIQRLQDLNLSRQEVGPEVEQEVLEVEPEERRIRSKSQDDCCCHVNCHHGDQFRNHGERSHKATERTCGCFIR